MGKADRKKVTRTMVDTLAKNMGRCSLKEESKPRRPPNRWFRMLYFKSDVGAQTNDPELMQQNFRYPVRVLPSKDKASTEDGLTAGDSEEEDPPKVEFVISPGFIESFKDKKLSKIFNQLAESGLAYQKIDTSSGPVVIHRQKVGVYRFKRCTTVNDEVMQKWENSLKKISKRSKGIKKTGKSGKRSKPFVAVPDTTVVAGGIETGVTLSSLKCLQPDELLNDEVLEYGMVNMLKNEFGSRDDILSVPVFRWKLYFERLIDGVDPGRSVERLYQFLVQRLPHKNLLKVKYLAIPVLKEQHWFLAIICRPFPDEKMVRLFEQQALESGRPLMSYSYELYTSWLTDTRHPPKVLLFDSLYRFVNKKGPLERIQSYRNLHAITANNCIMGLSWLHHQLWKNTPWTFQVDFFRMKYTLQFQTVDTPQQRNSSDCGLYLMRFLRVFLNIMKQFNGNYLSFDPKYFEHVYENSIWTIESREGLFEAIRAECQANSPQYYEALVRASKCLLPVAHPSSDADSASDKVLPSDIVPASDAV